MAYLSVSRLACATCGGSIEEAGYIPATDGADGYDPQGDAAVCDDCGFNRIGMTGCAPELDDVIEPGPNDVLLYVRAGADGYEIVHEK